MNLKGIKTIGIFSLVLFALWLPINREAGAGEKPEVFVQMGHTGRLSCLAVSPDGRHLLASSDKAIKLWDIQSGREIWTFQGHTGDVSCLAFSPDGRLAASGGRDNTVRVWDIEALRERRNFSLPNAVSAVAFTADGAQLLTAAGDIRLWDISSGQRIKRVFWGERQANSLAVSPDGARLASAGSSGTVIWDFATGEEIRKFGGTAYWVAFSPDGRHLLTADDALRLWDAASGQEVRKYDNAARFRQGVFTPDGRYVVASGRMQIGESYKVGLTLWEVSTSREIWFKPNLYMPAAVSPDGRTVFSSADNQDFFAPIGDIALWDLQSGREAGVFKGQVHNLTAAAFSPDGRLLAAGYHQGTLKVWDFLRGRNEWSLRGHTDLTRRAGGLNINSLAFSPNGLALLSAGGDGTARIRDAANGRQLRKFLGHPAYSAVFSPDGRKVVTASQAGLRVWDVSTSYKEKQFGNYSLAVALSPDGRLALSGGLEGAFLLWDIAAGKEIRRFAGHSGDVFSVAFSRDGRHALSGSADKTLRLWDVNSGKELRTFKSHEGTVFSAAFSPDGKQALSGSRDKTARLWDVATGMELKIFRGHANEVNSVAFSPDGQSAATGSSDSTLKLWDIASGREVRTLIGHTGPVNSVAFSPEGRTIVSGSEDQTMRVWESGTGKEVKKVDADFETVFSVAVSHDGRYVLLGGGATTLLWDAASGKLQDATFWDRWHDIIAAFSPEGKYVLAGGKGPNNLKVWDIVTGRETTSYTAHKNDIKYLGFSPDRTQAITAAFPEIKFWDISTGREVRSVGSKGFTGAVSRDGRYVLSADERDYTKPDPTGDHTVRLRETSTGREVQAFRGHASYVRTVALSPDGKYALSGSWDNTMRLWEISSGRELWNFVSPESISIVAFSPDSRFALAGCSSGAIRVKEVSSGGEVCTMLGFNDGEWVVITPEGFFNASKNGPSHINVRMGNRVYGLDQFYDVFYRPDLVEAKIAGENVGMLAAANLEEALRNPPPTVELTSVKESGPDRITVDYRISSAGGGIGEVRLFHNGKLVQSDGFYRQAGSAAGGGGTLLASNTRALKDEMRSVQITARQDKTLSLIESRPKGDTYEGSVSIDSVSGVNEIGLAAFNRNNTVQSVLKSAQVKSDRKPQVPHVYILSIGIDEYRSAKDNLKYAVKDARDIAARLREQFATRYKTESKFSFIHVKTLSNGEAGKSGIMKTVAELSRVIRPDDIFVFFIAGHGVIRSGLYSIVTHDYAGTLSGENVIDSNEIMEISRRIKALAQFFVLDTCHAGGLDNFIAGLYDARMTVLARNMGLHMFASASSTQEALDGYKGNGMFTYVLLEALNNNKNADLNSDRIVSIYELGYYAGEVTKKYSTEAGHTQTPVINNFGRDVGVYLLR